jgi:hypothetical protein
VSSAALNETGHGLRTGDLRSVPVTLIRSPHMSLIRYLMSGASARFAQRSRTVTPLMSTLSPDARRVLPALGAPQQGILVDCLTPIPPTEDTTVADQVHGLREFDSAELVREVNTLWGASGPPLEWQQAAREPRRWLDDLAQATVETNYAFASRWTHAAPVLEREIVRVGVAAVTGTADALLNSLHPRLRFRDGRLNFESACDRQFDLGTRRIALVPLIASRNTLAVSFGDDRVAWIAYSLPGIDPDRKDDAPDRLSLILGDLRSAIIRALDRPMTMRALASSVHCAPSTATYHCDHLVSAGLLTRSRQRQSMWISRTRRAADLMDVLAG